MSDSTRYVSVKFAPMGRAQTFLLGDIGLAPAPRTGERVVVQTESGPAVGAVVATIQAVAERHRIPADSPQKFVRKATSEDVILSVTVVPTGTYMS